MKLQTASVLPFALGHVSFLDVAGAATPRAQVLPSGPGAASAASRQLPPNYPAHKVATAALHFSLQQPPETASHRHLGLYDNDRQLIEWVLPTGTALLQDVQAPPTYLVETSQPRPKNMTVLDEGRCQPTEELYLPTAQWLERGLRHGHFYLVLRGRELHGEFLLQRLHPGSHLWELSLQRALPASFAA